MQCCQQCWVVWLSVWSEVQVVCIWSSWCHCHPIISCSSKIQNGLPFRCRLTQVVLEKRPLNGCNSSSSITTTITATTATTTATTSFKGRFSRWTWVSLPLSSCYFLPVLEEYRSYRWNGTVFVQMRCPSCHPTVTVKALRGTKH